MVAILVAFVSKEAAERFYSDPYYKLEAKCPYCKVTADIRRFEDTSKFDFPKELAKKVVYPSVGECQRCGRTILVGYKPLRVKLKQTEDSER